MEELTPEELESRIAQSSDLTAQVAHLIEGAAADFVLSLAAYFQTIGLDGHVPPSWIVYAVFQYVEASFGEISEENWEAMYSQSRQMRKIAEENPELIEKIRARKQAAFQNADQPDEAPAKTALDVALETELGLNFDE